jgi:hypothetical protein
VRALVRSAFYAFMAFFIAACLLVAFASSDPLVRLASGITAPVLLGALVLASRASDRMLERLCTVVWVFNFTIFIALIASTLAAGGGALNGYVQEGQCYLMDRGNDTVTDCQLYYSIAVLETLVFVSWPVGVVLAFSQFSRGNG